MSIPKMAKISHVRYLTRLKIQLFYVTSQIDSRAEIFETSI